MEEVEKRVFAIHSRVRRVIRMTTAVLVTIHVCRPRAFCSREGRLRRRGHSAPRETQVNAVSALLQLHRFLVNFLCDMK